IALAEDVDDRPLEERDHLPVEDEGDDGRDHPGRAGDDEHPAKLFQVLDDGHAPFVVCHALHRLQASVRMDRQVSPGGRRDAATPRSEVDGADPAQAVVFCSSLVSTGDAGGVTSGVDVAAEVGSEAVEFTTLSRMSDDAFLNSRIALPMPAPRSGSLPGPQ